MKHSWVFSRGNSVLSSLLSKYVQHKVIDGKLRNHSDLCYCSSPPTSIILLTTVDTGYWCGLANSDNPDTQQNACVLNENILQKTKK